MMRDIQLVALDLDGTLLNSQGVVSAGNRAAVRRAMQAGVQVVLATGKTRASAQGAIDQLDLRSPGVFTQGLVVTNGDGSIRYQQFLERETARLAYRFALAHALTPFAYSGMKILTDRDSPLRHRLASHYHEPLPSVVRAFDSWLQQNSINKLLLGVQHATFPPALRAEFETVVAPHGHVTQAVPHFLELLPAGTSKGAGLARLLLDLGISPRQVMAIGDGENDREMLQLVGVAVAVANAHPSLQRIADQVVADHDEDGVAEALERFLPAPPD